MAGKGREEVRKISEGPLEEVAFKAGFAWRADLWYTEGREKLG